MPGKQPSTSGNEPDLGARSARRASTAGPAVSELVELDLIYRSAPVGLAVIDRQLRFVRINNLLAALNGASVEAHLGRTVREMVPSVATQAEAALRHVLDTGEPLVDVEFAGESPTQPGVQGVWREQLHPIRDAHGEIVGISVVAEDISERRRTEAALLDSEARLAFLLRLADALRRLADPKAVLAEVSRALGTYLGADRVMYCEIDPADDQTFVLAEEFRHPDMPTVNGRHRVDGFGASIAGALRTERTLVVGDVFADPSRADIDRERYDAIRVRAFVAVPLVRAGRLGACLTVTQRVPRAWTEQEVSLIGEVAQRTWTALERARAEAALRESEQRFRIMADAVPQIVWITDSEGRVEFFNRHWTTYTGAPFEPTTAAAVAASFVHPDDHEMTLAAFVEARRTGGAFEVEHRIRSAAGDYRWFLVRAEPYRDPDSAAITRWFGASIDIHDRKVAEDALREAHVRKDEFLAMLAHELRNPLAPLTNALRLIARKETLSVAGDQAVAMATRQLRQLARLVDDLLEVSRVSQGRIELRREPMSISAAAFHAAESVKAAIEARRQRIEVAVPAKPIAVFADPARIAQILENLLVNASKFTPEGGRLRIEIEDCAAEVEVRVIDDGVGIEPAKIPQLFALFHQLDRTLDRSQGGLGIGLALVRRLTELHGGRVSARSEGPGRGATFVVRLPCLP